MATNFGKDTSCATSLRTGRFSTGTRLVGEAVYRRLTTPRGMLRGGEDEANYGLDLTELIGSSETEADAAALPGKVQQEVLKDERVNAAEVSVVRTVDGPASEYNITILCLTDIGPFDLTIGVDEVSAELIGITAES